MGTIVTVTLARSYGERASPRTTSCHVQEFHLPFHTVPSFRFSYPRNLVSCAARSHQVTSGLRDSVDWGIASAWTKVGPGFGARKARLSTAPKPATQGDVPRHSVPTRTRPLAGRACFPGLRSRRGRHGGGPQPQASPRQGGIFHIPHDISPRKRAGGCVAHSPVRPDTAHTPGPGPLFSPFQGCASPSSLVTPSLGIFLPCWPPLVFLLKCPLVPVEQ